MEGLSFVPRLYSAVGLELEFKFAIQYSVLCYHT
jgi:hypothetical protein